MRSFPINVRSDFSGQTSRHDMGLLLSPQKMHENETKPDSVQPKPGLQKNSSSCLAMMIELKGRIKVHPQTIKFTNSHDMDER